MTASGASQGLTATLAANIKRQRVARGLTQHDLAVKLNLSDAVAVSRWERGLHPPNDENRVALAALLFDGDVGALYREPEPEAA